MKNELIPIFTKIGEEDGTSPPTFDETLLSEENNIVGNSPPQKVFSVEKEESPPKMRIFKKEIFRKIDEEPSKETSTENAANETKVELPMNTPPPASKDIKRTLVIQKSESSITGDSYGNFTIKILRRIRRIDKDERVEIFYDVEILTNNGEVYHGRVSGSQLESLTWIREISGGAAYFSTAKNARTQVLEILHALIDNKHYDERIEFVENGWKKIEYKWYYATDFGLIGENQNVYFGDYSRSFIYDKSIVGMKNTFETALKMTNICEDKSITLPLLLFTHLGILCTPYELAEVPIKGVMALIGTTNSRKTSLALCMTRIFNRNNLKTADISFESTLGGLEKESSKYSDSVFLIDDIHPTTSKKNYQKMMDALEFILRRYGDRIPKIRMTDFMTNKTDGTYDISGVCLLTGEDIGGVQSSMTRTLILEIDKFSVKNDILSFYQNNPYILTSYLYDFIAYISKNFEQIINFIKHRVTELRATRTYEIPRYAEYFAQLMTCAEIIAHYAVDRGFWNDEEAANWNMWCETVLHEVICKNLIHVEREDFAVMILQALQVEIDESCVMLLQNLTTERIGYNQIVEDEKYYYIQSEYLIELTKKFWTKQGKDIPFTSSKQLTLFMEQKDLIVVRKEKDSTRRTLALPKRKQRVLYIKKNKMFELLRKVEI